MITENNHIANASKMKISDLDSYAKRMKDTKPKYDYRDNTLENRVKAAELKPLPESANQFHLLSISEYSALYLHRYLTNRLTQLSNQLREPNLRPIRVEKKAVEYKLLSETLNALNQLVSEIESRVDMTGVLSYKKVSVHSLIEDLRRIK